MAAAARPASTPGPEPNSAHGTAGPRTARSVEQNRSMMKAPLTRKQLPTPRSGGPAERLPEPFGAVALDPAAKPVLDAEAVENSHAALLAEYPDAPVAAVKPDGLFVEPPESLPIDSHPRLQGAFGPRPGGS